MITNVNFIFKDNEFVIPSTLKNSITCLDVISTFQLKVIEYLENTSDLELKKGNSTHSFYYILKQKIKNIEKQKINSNDKLYNGLENLSEEHQSANNYSPNIYNPCKMEPHFIKGNRVFLDSKQIGLKR